MSFKDTPEYRKVVEEQRAKDMGYTHANEHSRSMQGKVLAELLGVTPASLSGAAKNDHRCQGYRVSKWAVRDTNGKVLSYHVPLNVYNTLSESHQEQQADQERSNPGPRTIGVSKSSKEESKKTTDREETEGSETTEDSVKSDTEETEDLPAEEPERAGFTNTGDISLLPKGQSYVEPVVAGSLGSVGTSLVETDTPNSRSIMYSVSAGVGSYMGYKFANDHWMGALIGGAIGLGTAYIGNMSYNRGKSANSDLADDRPQQTSTKSSDNDFDWEKYFKQLTDHSNSSESDHLESVDLSNNKVS